MYSVVKRILWLNYTGRFIIKVNTLLHFSKLWRCWCALGILRGNSSGSLLPTDYTKGAEICEIDVSQDTLREVCWPCCVDLLLCPGRKTANMGQWQNGIVGYIVETRGFVFSGKTKRIWNSICFSPSCGPLLAGMGGLLVSSRKAKWTQGEGHWKKTFQMGISGQLTLILTWKRAALSLHF